MAVRADKDGSDELHAHSGIAARALEGGERRQIRRNFHEKQPN